MMWTEISARAYGSGSTMTLNPWGAALGWDWFTQGTGCRTLKLNLHFNQGT